MNKFGMTGIAGYVAPRHLKAIKDTGNSLLACFDPHDSVGILDRFFPHADFFYEYERFERHLNKLAKKTDTRIDYLSICSPNNFHDSHIRLALNVGADAICEKPMVLFPRNLDLLEALEEKTEKKVYTVMQLRYHQSLLALKERIEKEGLNRKHKVELTYITSRGSWYNYSWKGNVEKSGGVATNIGIHLFDLLIWLFGKVEKNEVFLSENNKMSGMIELKNAEVVWFLSIDKDDLSRYQFDKDKTTFRSIKVDGQEVEFSEGFTELHTTVYQEILKGNGLRIKDARPSIELVHDIRFSETMQKGDLIQPYLR
jgi:UDP-N-acetyl-2-amino-2-deoxyglucuronate dehydrogenase